MITITVEGEKITILVNSVEATTPESINPESQVYEVKAPITETEEAPRGHSVGFESPRGTPLNCLNCGKEFIPLQRLQKKAKYCSTACRLEANKKPKRIVDGARRIAESPSARLEEANRNFTDPWDCLVCRGAQSICDMHEKMTLDGKHPPRYRL